MENKNVINNLIIKQINKSNAIAYNKKYLAESSDYDFKILDNAYADTAKLYASLKMSIINKKCTTPNCYFENVRLKQLEKAPQISIDFLQNIAAELSTVEDPNFDVNNNYEYTVANSILTAKPGFSRTDGYITALQLNEDGSQTIIFDGPMFESPLVINNTALIALLESDTSLVASTPDINKDMLRLLTEVGVFSPSDVLENGSLKPNARISDEFIMTNPDGSYDYEIIEIGGGKGRNILKFDMDKIDKKVTPFINAEVAGLLSSEQETVAAWNVYITQGTSVEEDDQMVQNANAGSKSWSYEQDLPLSQDKKVLFESKYKDYFMNNYLKQFTTNQLPAVIEDAAVFDYAEAKQAKADKFIKENS